MQTFLPYASIEESLFCLDNKRLGKQRVEAKTIISTLIHNQKGWANHPAVKMWRGYLPVLFEYYNTSLQVWDMRGFKNLKLKPLIFSDFLLEEDSSFQYPPWWGGPIHPSHRANLLRKDPTFYSRYNWDEDPATPYYWPVQ